MIQKPMREKNGVQAYDLHTQTAADIVPLHDSLGNAYYNRGAAYENMGKHDKNAYADYKQAYKFLDDPVAKKHAGDFISSYEQSHKLHARGPAASP